MTDEELTAYLDQYRHVWPTNAKWWSWLRGRLREGIWNKNPIKIEYKKSMAVKPDPSYTGRAKSLVKCGLTGEMVGYSKAQVDHMDGNVPFNKVEDILPFLLHLTLPRELQCVDPEAHKVKSYAERQGVSFEDALLVKKAIVIEKGDWRAFLDVNGEVSKGVKVKDRRQAILAVLSRK